MALSRHQEEEEALSSGVLGSSHDIERLADFLLPRLPAPPRRLLVVGVESASLDARLAGHGYQVRHLAVFGEEPLTAEPYDAMLLLPDAVDGHDPLPLLAAAQEGLVAVGELLLLGAFRTPTGAGGEEDQGVRDFIALAERFGFIPRQRLDRPEALTANHGMPCFLHLQREEGAGWCLRSMAPSHQEEMRALFAKVFGHQLSPELWRWKYDEGRGCGIGAWRQGHLLAHFGGLVRMIRMGGRQWEGVQIVDVMADAKGREGVSRKGAFFHAAATFFERFVGVGKRFLFGYGFPNFRHMRVGEQLGLYEKVDRISEVRWPAMPARFSLRTKLRAIDPGCDDPSIARKIDALWAAMANDLSRSVVGVRDWPYIRQRFLRHPSFEYQVILASRRFGGSPVGLLVTRRDGEELLLLDVVAPMANLPELLHHARRLAARLGLACLRAWITSSHAAPFQATGGECRETDIFITNCCWCPGLPPEELRDRWWLTAGDTEFQ